MSKEHLIKEFIIHSSALVGYQLTVSLSYAISTVFIGRLGISLSLAAYGIGRTIISIGFRSILAGVQESLGVVCANLYGTQEYKKIWRYLWKSIAIVLTVALVFHILSYHSGNFMVFIGLEKEVAMATERFLKLCAISLYFQGVNSVLNNFLSAQKITNPLFYLNFISIAIVYIGAVVFIDYMKLAELGFGYTKICQDIFNFIYYIVVINKYIDKTHIEGPSISNLKENFVSFAKLNIFTILTYYGEVISYETNMYYAALLHDVDALAIYVTFVNFSAFHYFTGIGFGNAARNLVGMRLGELQVDNAKTESILYIKVIGIFSLMVAILQSIYSDSIARLFATKEIVVQGFQRIILLYCTGIFITFILPSLNTLHRLIGKNSFIVMMNVTFYPLTIAVVSYITCFGIGLKVWGIVLGYLISKTFLSAILIWSLYNHSDWSAAIIDKDAVDGYRAHLVDKSLNESTSLKDQELN